MKYEKLISKVNADELPKKVFPIGPPDIHPRVVPKGKTAPVTLAMDSYDYMQEVYSGQGFPGYSYLSQLATRAEYRAFAAALSTELTRKGIEFTSKQDDDDERIAQIEKEFKRLGVMQVLSCAAQHDSYFGAAHIFIELQGHDISSPLIISNKTIEQGSLKRITTVEPIWATPSAYNSSDPTRPDFFKPTEWFMLGKRIHASRLCTVVTRELPDILKPAFNFGGMSLSQLAEPYVENWLRTRQSVSDLINNFSITVLATSMDQVLQDDEEAGLNLINRATLFTKLKSNKGLMLVDKEREEILQVNTPLSGLHELQAQSQEQMCSVSRIPTIILTGISPSGLNASSDGEIRVFYDWIAAQQEAYWREPLETILSIVQLSLFGKIDPDIDFRFVPLYQMTELEEAEIRFKNASTAALELDRGVIDPQEERERLARDDNSGYAGLDLTKEIVQPIPDMSLDSDFKESEHPRDADGKFSSGGGGKQKIDLPDKIKVNGNDVSTKNSDGQYIADNVKDIEEFYEWFGDSYVSDNQGRPKVVYHFTDKEFDEFDPSLSDGIWFTDNPNVDLDDLGSAGSKHVKKAYIKITDPEYNGSNYDVDSIDGDGLINKYEYGTDYAVKSNDQIKLI